MRKAIAITAVLLSTAITSAPQRQPVDEVDTTIGNVGILLEPTRPTAYLPNSIVRVYPVRKDALADQVHYFPLTILSHRQADLFAIMPGEGTPLTYDNEHATPSAYSARLGDKNIGVEFAPAHQAGIFRFQFLDGKATVTLCNLHPGSLKVEGKDAFSGEEKVMGLTAYFYAEPTRRSPPLNKTLQTVKPFTSPATSPTLKPVTASPSSPSNRQRRISTARSITGTSHAPAKKPARRGTTP